MWKELVKNEYIYTEHEIYINNVLIPTENYKKFPSFKHITESWIGGFPIKTASFELKDINLNINLQENDKVELFRVHKINNQMVKTSNGKFLISKITTDKSAKSVKVECSDYTSKFASKYETNLKYEGGATHSGLEIIQEVCNKVDVPLMGTFSFASYQFKQPNFPANTSYREVVSRMAELGGEIAIINTEGKLIFKKPQLKDITIDKGQRQEYIKEKPKNPISRLSLGVKGVNDDYLTGEELQGKSTYRIEDNPYASLYRDEIAPKVLENIKDRTITEFNIKGVIDDCFIEINDIIKLINNDGTEEYIIVLGIENDGTFRSNIYAKPKENNKTNYLIAGTTRQSILETKLEVNHIKGEISSFTEKISNSERLATNAQQTVLGIINKVEAQKENEEKRYTEIKQKVDSVTTSIQTSGTDNIIQDSVMYGLRKGQKISPVWEVTKFDKDKSKILSIIPDTETVSRCGFELVNSKIKQKLEVMANNVKNDIKYTLTVKLQKISMLGRFELKIYNINKEGQEENVRNIIIEVGENTEYKEYKIENIQFSSNIAYIELIASNSNISVTDLMLNQGIAGVWTQANGETRNSNVTIGIEGINLSNESTGDRLEITSAKITGYSKAEGTETEIFKVSGEDTIIKNAKIGSFIEMIPFTVISLGKDGEGDSGWAWIINERS